MSSTSEETVIESEPAPPLADCSSEWDQQDSEDNNNGDNVTIQETENDTGSQQSSAENQQLEDDPFSSLAHLQKYGTSSNVSERQNAARNIVKTLQNVEQDEAAVQVVFSLVEKTFAEDVDAVVRGELLEQLPMICMHCSQAPFLCRYIRDVLFPLLVKFLNDPNAQVRKTCHAAILILVEQGFLTEDAIVELIYPELIKLSRMSFPDDVRVEAVCLLCKLVPTLGREPTIKLFLNRFTELCEDSLFHIRKTCAAHLGEMSRVVGQEVTEKRLVPHLISLSQDSVWGVRKTCAECFTDISYNCAMQTRRHQLAPVFIVLLADSSRWVQCSAFQALGPFISTFADSNRTGLKWVEGELVYQQPESGGDSPLIGTRQKGDPSVVPLGMTAEEFREEADKLFSLLDDGELFSFAVTSNLAQLAQQRLNGDVARPETSPCLVDTPKGTDPTGEERPDETAGRSDVDTEYHSFKFWQPSYYQDITEASLLPNLTLESTTEEAGEDSVELTRQDTYGRFADRMMKEDYKQWAEVKPTSRTEETGEDTRLEEDPVELTKQDTYSRITDRMMKDYMKEDYGNWRRVGDANDDNDALKSDAACAGRETTGEEEKQYDVEGEGDENKPRTSDNGQEEQRTDERSESPDQDPIPLDHYVSFPSHDRGAHGVSPDITPKNFEYQDIIPQALLDQFLSMVEPSRAQAIESDISRHCAFNLPAVAFTIGRKHWPLIKPTYMALANDMQWKVRRTLAFSIHELAAILGTDLTVQDLLPVFSGFLRDLDEVRIGILRHLYDFLKLLDKDVRRSLLSSLADFLQTDNCRSWRFRHLFADQLILLCELFDIQDINDYLSPIAMTLAIDRIAEIRHVTHKLLSTILRYFYKVEAAQSDMCHITDSFIQDIVKGFAKSQRWVRRQTFIYVCREVVRTSAVSDTKFADELLPSLLSLAQDQIPNVRIALSSLFAELSCVNSQFLTNPEYTQQVSDTMKLFTMDRDRDVRLNAVMGAFNEHTVFGDSFRSDQTFLMGEAEDADFH